MLQKPTEDFNRHSPESARLSLTHRGPGRNLVRRAIVRAHLPTVAHRRDETASPTRSGPRRNGRARLGRGAATANSPVQFQLQSGWACRITVRHRSLPGPRAVPGPVPH